MAFYMLKANYSADAIKAMLGQPQDREAAARKAIEALGGTLHNFFFSLGDSTFLSPALVSTPVFLAGDCAGNCTPTRCQRHHS